MKQNLPHRRVSFRLCGLVLLGLLSLATAVVPSRAAAFQADVPAQPEVVSPAQEAKHPPETQAAKTEEQENDQYRHSSMVQSLAKLMHMDVETAARMFEIINVAVVLLAIVIPLARLVPRLLRKRSEKIRADIETAQKTTQDANTRLKAVEAKLANLDEEIAKFRAEAEQQIALDEHRNKAALEEERARIVASAEQEISVAAAQAKRSLRHFATDLAIEQAAKRLVLTPETDRELIAEFVKEAGRDGANGGGES